MNLNQEFITSIIPHAIYEGKPFVAPAHWSVDSRTVAQDDFFVALSGAQVDGHDFVIAALERGACGVMIAAAHYKKLQAQLAPYMATRSCVIVPSPQDAVCAIAAAWRRCFTCPVVGITGSVGKTSTKEILGNMVRASGKRCLVSQGNQNTLIGMSLNILMLRPEHEVAVFEMGISKRGEMAKLAELAAPTMGVITAIGHSHMEGLGSIMDIAAEKRDIFKYLPENGIGVIDGDQPLLATISYRHPVIKFGRKMVNQVQARKIQHTQEGVQFQLKIYDERHLVELATQNSARIQNVLAAATAAHALGISLESTYQGIMVPLTSTGRFKQYAVTGTASVVIDDSYNANPESMKAALHAFEKIEGHATKVAVLGDMLELGVNAPFWHRQLGRFLRKVPSVNRVIFIGEQVKWAEKMVPFGMTVTRVASWRDALPLLQPYLNEGSLVLVKASRGIGLSNLVTALLSRDAA